MPTTSEPDRLAEALEAFLARPSDAGADPTAASREFLQRNERLRDLLGPMLERDEGPAAPAPSSNPKPGHVLGRYRLLEELGRGGMGVVFDALELGTSRHVAVKVLPALRARSPRAVERFRREAQAIGSLRHRGIVEVLDAGQDAGVHWIAMERVDGRSLRDAWLDVLAACDGDATAVPQGAGLGLADSGAYWREVCLLGIQVADALAHAHAAGILHRDVKPQNVLIDLAGRARLVDFGLALAPEAEPLTLTGDFAGTPHYASPERLAGTRQGVDGRSDVFSLGVVLYELLAMRRPFDGDTPAAVLDAVRAQPPRSLRAVLPGLPRDLAVAIDLALDPDPARRPDAVTFRQALEAVLNGSRGSLRPLSVPVRTGRWLHRHRVAVLAGSLLAVGLLGTPIGLALHYHRTSVAVAAEQRVTEANYLRARQAIDTLLRRVAAYGLSDAPGMQELRASLFRDARQLFVELRAGREDDVLLAFQAAEAAGGIAAAELELGRSEASLPWFDVALGELQALAAGGGLGELRLRTELAIGIHRADRGRARSLARGDLVAARDDQEGARRRLDALLDDASLTGTEVQRVQIELARIETSLGLLLREQEPETALEQLGVARERWASLGDAVTADAVSAREYAQTELVYGGLMASLGREAETAYALRHAHALLDRAEELGERVSGRVRLLRASVFTGESMLHGMRGETEAAQEDIARAREIVEDLVAFDPTALAPRRLRADLDVRSSERLLTLGRTQEASERAEAALRDVEVILDHHPGDLEVRRTALRAVLAAHLTLQSSRPAAAGRLEDLFARGRVLHAALSTQGLATALDDASVGGLLSNHARWLMALAPERDQPRAHVLVREAIGLLESAHRAMPGHGAPRRSLWVSYRICAALAMASRDRDEARRCLAQGVELAADAEECLQTIETLLRIGEPARGLEAVIDWFDRGLIPRESLRSDSRLDPLRDEPTFPDPDRREEDR